MSVFCLLFTTFCSCTKIAFVYISFICKQKGILYIISQSKQKFKYNKAQKLFQKYSVTFFVKSHRKRHKHLYSLDISNFYNISNFYRYNLLQIRKSHFNLTTDLSAAKKNRVIILYRNMRSSCKQFFHTHR